MKVIDIINLVAKLVDEIDVKNCVDYCLKNNLSLSELFSLSNDDTQQLAFLNENSKTTLNTMLDAVNITQTLIATEYKPVFKTEQINIQNNEFLIENLSQQLFKVKEITLNNKKQKFVITDNKISVENGNALITYSYIPSQVCFEDTIKNFNGVSIITMAYLVCAQYCLIKCSFEESSMWQQKFEQALLNNFKPINNISIKTRRWS